jgi:hypothetical protein
MAVTLRTPATPGAAVRLAQPGIATNIHLLQQEGIPVLITTVTTRLATLEDLDTIKYIADRNKKTIGFVNRAALIEAVSHECLYVAEDIRDDCVIGFANIWRRKKDDWLTLMEICIDVDYRLLGAGRALNNHRSPLQLRPAHPA